MGRQALQTRSRRSKERTTSRSQDQVRQGRLSVPRRSASWKSLVSLSRRITRAHSSATKSGVTREAVPCTGMDATHGMSSLLLGPALKSILSRVPASWRAARASRSTVVLPEEERSTMSEMELLNLLVSGDCLSAVRDRYRATASPAAESFAAMQLSR